MASELSGIGTRTAGLRMPQEVPEPRTVRPDVAIDPGSGTGAQKPGFGATLNEFLGQVNQTQLASESTFRRFVRGEAELHEVGLAAREAEIALRLTVEIRDRLLTAYQEVSRMQM